MKTKTVRVALFALCASVVSVGAFLFFWYSIGTETAAYQELQDEMLVLQERESKLDVLTESVRAITSDREKLDGYFLHEDDIVSFLETIESLSHASTTVVEVTSVDQGSIVAPELGDGTEGGTFTSPVLSIAVEGSWQEVFHVFSLIETLPVPLAVHQVSIDVINLRTQPLLWKGSFRISVLQQ